MSLKIETGLFLLDDFTDCHAILGISVEADAKTIRKRYLKVAQRLHPDSFLESDETEKNLATQIFSKLVGPAYNTLCKERERKEYLLLISLKGKQGIQQRTSIANFSPQAKALANSTHLKADYEKAIEDLSQSQYDNLQNCLQITGLISELNLVYLMRRESEGHKPISSPPPSVASSSSSAASSSSPTATTSPAGAAAPPTPESAAAASKASIVDNYLRRAEEYMNKNAYAQAILELRDALNISPKDSRCHSLMGMVYLKQNQLTMAKVSIKRALELNPLDPNAIKAKVQLERLGQSLDAKASGTAAKPSSSTQGGQNKETKGGGLFGLFGGKKK